MKSVIITGGLGKRLRPLTYEVPKGLIPVHGRNLLDHVIDLFWKYNIYENWFILGYKWNKIKEEYSYLPFIREDEPLGTGGWLKTIKDDPNPATFQKFSEDDFFVCNGDNLFNLDLASMMQTHRDNDAVVTIACTEVDDIRKYGSVTIEEGKITEFNEKADKKDSGWISGGYYIFSPEIFDYLPDEYPISLEKDVFPKLAKEGKLQAFKSNGQWFDTGTFERYENVLKEWDGIQ